MLFGVTQYYDSEKEDYKALEEWMKLGLFLGDFLKSYKQNINVYVSTPTNLLISYLIVLGAVNQEFKDESNNNLRTKYLQLKRGSKVHYNSQAGWKSCSVLEVVPHPIDNKIMTIALLDNKKTKVYVPEDKWEKNIRISSLEQTTIKNASKVKNVYNLEDNKILSHLYSTENLKRSQNKNSSEIFVFGNKKEWIENLRVLSFSLNNHFFTLKDFVYPDQSAHFKNVDFLTYSSSDETRTISENAMVIFLGASRTLRKMDEYKNYKNLYLIDRHENIEKIESLKEKIEQQILIEGSEVKNNILLEALRKNSVKLPRGVEVFAWE